MSNSKGLIANVFKFGLYDCSNGGLSSKHNILILVGNDHHGEPIPEIFNVTPEHPAVEIDRAHWDRFHHIIAKPVMNEEFKKVWFMFGGTFIYTSDSRFPSQYPIPLYDRVE